MQTKEYAQTVKMLKTKVSEMCERGQKEILLTERFFKEKPVAPGGTLDELNEKVKRCRKCPLGASRIKAVFGVGNRKAKVMFIGEGPGYDEDRQGEPFVGRAGKLLDKMMASIGLDREKVYIANVVKCHPMIDPKDPEKRGNDRPPSPEEAAKCLPYLRGQINIIDPAILCILGATAMRNVLGIEDPIGKVRGRFMDFDEGKRRMLVTYHPAALLRNPSFKVKSWEDLKLLRDAIKKLS